MSVLDAQGPVAAADAKMMLNALGIMLAIVIPTLVAALAFAWWFRAANRRARRLPRWAYSGRIEIVVWAIPLLVITFLGGLTWIGSHELDPFRPLASRGRPLEIQVVSLDWKWLFIYPEQGVASVNELAVPAGVPLHFSLTSASVMNSFFVPQLGSMIATMNGMVTQLYLQADRPGEYYGLSTQFSGDGFSGMHFIARALAPEEFRQWLDKARGSGAVLDGDAYARLAEQSANVRPFTYRGVAPGLFRAIAELKIAPAAGPQKGHGGPRVNPRPIE